MRDVVKAMRALSDETRLRILHLLLDKELCVCEIEQTLGISQTRASRNLGLLCDAGFLKLRKDGLWSLYSLDSDRIADYYARLIEAVRQALESNKTAQADRERLKEVERTSPRCAVGLTR